MNNVLDRENSIVTVSDNPFLVTDVGLVIRGNPTFDQWYRFGQGLSRTYSNIQWCVGDWLNEGEKRYGEMYSQALDSHIYNYGTLRNYASIAGRIPKEVRNPKLRFHQSKYVAPLEPDEQKRILDFAADKNLSGDDIQELVNKVLGKSARTANGQQTDEISTSVILNAEPCTLQRVIKMQLSDTYEAVFNFSPEQAARLSYIATQTRLQITITELATD